MIIVGEHEISQADGRCVDCGRNRAQCEVHHVCDDLDTTGNAGAWSEIFAQLGLDYKE